MRIVLMQFYPEGKARKAFRAEICDVICIKHRESYRARRRFGNEKNHYLLNKVKARTQATEIVWIFFEMLAANASILSKRINSQQLQRTG